jgi:flavorubredoxin
VKKILIIYHSQSGNTEAMAKAVYEGTKGGGANVVLKKAVEAGAEDILGCDLIAIGTPSYFGYMAGMVKDFFDRVWASIRDKVTDKPYIVFGSKGGGGAQAVDSVERICDGLRMIKAFEGVLATRAPTDEDLARCREIGKNLARIEKVERPSKIEEPRL